MATNKPQDDYKKTALRLPPELHERLHEAATASGRSYNAEIVARLEDSLSKKSPSGSAQREVDMYIAALQNQSVMLDMRVDILKMRLDSLGARIRAITAETAGLDVPSLTNAELDDMEVKTDELREAGAEMAAMRSEMKALQEQRRALLESITSLRTAVSTKASELEEVLAEAAARGLKKPASN